MIDVPEWIHWIVEEDTVTCLAGRDGEAVRRYWTRSPGRPGKPPFERSPERVEAIAPLIFVKAVR